MCPRAPGPWEEQRPRKHSSRRVPSQPGPAHPGSRQPGPARPGPRVPSFVRQPAASLSQVMRESNPLSTTSQHTCYTAGASMVWSCSSLLRALPGTRHVSHTWHPSPVTHTKLVHSWPCFLFLNQRPTQHPSVKCPASPGCSAQSFIPPMEIKFTSFMTPYAKSALLNYFHSIMKHHFEVDKCVIFNYFNLTGSSSN